MPKMNRGAADLFGAKKKVVPKEVKGGSSSARSVKAPKTKK